MHVTMIYKMLHQNTSYPDLLHEPKETLHVDVSSAILVEILVCDRVELVERCRIGHIQSANFLCAMSVKARKPCGQLTISRGPTGLCQGTLDIKQAGVI